MLAGERIPVQVSWGEGCAWEGGAGENPEPWGPGAREVGKLPARAQGRACACRPGLGWADGSLGACRVRRVWDLRTHPECGRGSSWQG